ncbi:MAG TPA: hypothetical protein GX528_07885 [Firmicutes bacterium]|nr:hypothetical protein [Bacillota bacterium]
MSSERANTTRILILALALFLVAALPVSAGTQLNYFHSNLIVDSLAAAEWLTAETILVESQTVEITEIDEALLPYTYLKIEEGRPQKIGGLNKKAFTTKEGFSEAQVLFHREIIWLTPGEYSLKLKFATEAGDQTVVDVTVNVAPFTAIFFIEPTAVKIEATKGPGLYKAKEPVEIRVQSNNNAWHIYLTAEKFHFSDKDNKDVTLKPSELLVKVNGAKDYQSFEKGISLHPSSFPGGIAILELAALVDWHHLAGSYEGTVQVVLFSRKW